MAWKTMEVHEQRVRFVVAALRRERSLTSLCREFEISRPTGRLWLERYRAGGVASIAERSRRPVHSPRQTAPELEQRVVQLRLRYPDWGARKLQVLLRQAGFGLPASTIHRILLRHHLVQDQDRHAPSTQRLERGVPHAMLMDHGVPWWSWAGPQAATTGLALWLMKQGIRLHWSGIGHPQTQGKVERFHGSLQRALDKRGLGEESPQPWLDRYRWEHNHVRPHEALGMQTPASRWQPSLRRYDPNPPRWQYPEGSRVLKVDCQGKLDIRDTRWRVGRALAGEWVQIVEIESRLQVYYCTTLIRELEPSIQRSTIVERWIETRNT